jgi:prepilin-type N-terminal cleavage/methylation domain-containing protein
MFVSLRRRPRGFTLTELMIVVALVGTLAAIGVASFRRELDASKSSEAAAVIQAIRAAQETYRAENQRYLDVSGSAERWYPVSSFDDRRHPWINEDHEDYTTGWKRLAAPVTQPVTFRYVVRAGMPGTNFPTLPVAVNLGTAVDPWYVIRARADANENGTFCDVIATSLNNELVILNEGE